MKDYPDEFRLSDFILFTLAVLLNNLSGATTDGRCRPGMYK